VPREKEEAHGRLSIIYAYGNIDTHGYTNANFDPQPYTHADIHTSTGVVAICFGPGGRLGRLQLSAVCGFHPARRGDRGPGPAHAGCPGSHARVESCTE
jgi:hypothetical protein